MLRNNMYIFTKKCGEKNDTKIVISALQTVAHFHHNQIPTF